MAVAADMSLSLSGLGAEVRPKHILGTAIFKRGATRSCVRLVVRLFVPVKEGKGI